jgi:FMN phosphatase YigB (HAD superfamily)
MSKNKAVIFDFNGTLKRANGKPVKRMLKKALKDEKKEHVIVLSGESHEKKDKTEEWLKKEGLGKAELDVRPTGVSESDPREKARELNDHISRQFNVKKAYDDKKANREMFRAHGIKAKKP